MGLEDNDGWCTIESDPGVFTELIRELGTKGLQVEELYGLDEGLMDELKPIFGFIFLFKWDPATEKGKQQVIERVPEGLFFANQTVQNACATQAILSILLNIPVTSCGVELGNDLLNFKDFCVGLTPELRGEAIGSNELIRKIHNSFSRPEMAMIEVKNEKRGKDEEPFHFISILPIGETIYEFDGLQPGPVSHGSCGDNWLSPALEVIKDKIRAIQSMGEEEIRFNLMAVIKDRTVLYREKLDAQIRLACEIENSLRLNPSTSPNDPRQQQIQMILAQNEEWEAKLEEEQLKNAQWRRENARRRHNFIPFAVTLLQEMVRTGRADKFIS